MTFELPPLPYGMGELAPHISKETLEYHYGKHHQAYVTNLNKLVAGQSKTLEEHILTAGTGPVFNNAAQIWNHTFYWHSLSPTGGKAPVGRIADLIDRDFGSFSSFKDAFTTACTGLFGSGWVFLVLDKSSKLQIKQEVNAGNPMTSGMKPLLTCDVWEHAYYIDYRNARPKYVEIFWNLVNWDFANKNLG